MGIAVLLRFAAAGLLVLPACATATPSARDSDVGPPPPPAVGVEVDGWVVTVSVQPAAIGPVAVSIENVAPDPGEPEWIGYDVRLTNMGEERADFDDTRAAGFIRRDGNRILLVADMRCGFGEGNVVQPICLRDYTPFVVAPGSSEDRGMILYKELSGMTSLAEGEYVFRKSIRFRVGDRAFSDTLQFTFDVRKGDSA